MSPTDAAAAFKNFFKDDHPYRLQRVDTTKLQDVGTTGSAWNETIGWWWSKSVPTGNEIMFYINPRTRVNIEGTVIEYSGSSYRIWSCASVVS